MLKVKKILVPIDFSEASETVLSLAASMAEQCGASLLILHIVEKLNYYAGLSVPHISFEELEKGLLSSATKKMEETLETMRPGNLVCASRVVAGRDVSEAILETAASEDSDLMVLGTRGHQGIERMLLGSVAERVLRNAPCPVLTVNPRGKVL